MKLRKWQPRGVLGQDDYAQVCRSTRLADGTLWPIPVTLDLPEEVAVHVPPGRGLALRDQDDTLLGVLHVTQSWRPDRHAGAEAVFGTATRVRCYQAILPYYPPGRAMLSLLPLAELRTAARERLLSSGAARYSPGS